VYICSDCVVKHIVKGQGMTQLSEYVEYLSKNIGARPAGTEEERQAALYITEQFQKTSGYPTIMEDFTSSTNMENLRAICAAVAIIATVLAMFLPILSIPAFVLVLLACAIYALEAYGKPVVSRALARGASQNVVAKYQPNVSTPGQPRSRKVVLVAHYDSGRAKPGFVTAVEDLAIPLGPICVGAMVALAVFAFLRMVLFGQASGVALIAFNILTVIALLIAALPVVRAVACRLAPYNEGANNNATGVAALLEVARRISRGSVSEADLAAAAADVTIHGEEDAYEANLVPEGARLVYEASQLVPPDLGPQTDEERLLAAKAAIAAFTGKAVPTWKSTDVADKLVGSRATPTARVVEFPSAAADEPQEVFGEGDAPESIEFVESADQTIETVASEDAAPAVGDQTDDQAADPAPIGFAMAAPALEPQPQAESNLPAWFVSAQKKAKRSGDTGEVRRSVYADAIEAAERERAAREAELQRQREEEAREKAREQAREAAEAMERARQEQEAAQAEAREVEKQQDENTPAADSDAFADEVDNQVEQESAAEKPIPDEEQAIEGQTDEAPVARRPIVLPSISGYSTKNPVVSADEPASPSRSSMFRKLRVDIPSLSGAINVVGDEADQDQNAAGAIWDDGAFEAGTAEDYASKMYDDEPEPQVEPESAYEPTPMPEPEKPTYDQLPKSRFGRFFDKFRKKKRSDMEETPQQWLNVDEEFDPRTVGRVRGGWESFRDDSVGAPGENLAAHRNDYDDFDDEYFDYEDEPADNGRPWNGGGFSRVRMGGTEDEIQPEEVSYASTSLEPWTSGQIDTQSSGELYRPHESENRVNVDLYAPIEEEEEHDLAAEMEGIYHFRNPNYNTEVWFVAIGSDIDTHDGTRAFVEAHKADLRGAMIVEVESLGGGRLSVVQEEGLFKKVKASSRVKRYTKKANQATGITLADAIIPNADSIASVAQKEGVQAMHVAGMDGNRPHSQASADDVFENLNFDLLEENVDYLMELVRTF